MKRSEMLIIKASVFILNILAILCVDLWLWTLSWCSGVGGLVGLVGFLIGYSVSGGMTIAPRDYWRLPDYEVFRKKLRYGNSICGSTVVAMTVILYIIKAIITGS